MNQPSTTRYLVTHDCSVFRFDCVDGLALHETLCCIYKPYNKDKIYKATNNNVGLYMAISSKNDIVDSMVPKLFDTQGVVTKELTSEDVSTMTQYELQCFQDEFKVIKKVTPAVRVSLCDNKKFKQIYVRLINDDWSIEYSYFEGKVGVFDNKNVQYALNSNSFLKLCANYGLSMFGPISYNGLSRGTPRDTSIAFGKYKELDCVVKRGSVKSVGAYLHSYLKHRKLQRQGNIVRLEDSMCDGVDYQIIWESCDGRDLYHYSKIKENSGRGRIKNILKDALKCMINMQDEKVVHDRIRPKHIMVNKFETLNDVGKIGGASEYKLVKNDNEHKKDVYDYGRSMLEIFDTGHIFVEDDDDAKARFLNGEMFQTEVQVLREKDPLAAHLVEECLSRQVSAKELRNHPWFCMDGSFLDFMQRYNDTMHSDANLYNAILRAESKIVIEEDSTWIEGFSSYPDWIKHMHIGAASHYTYNGNKILDLLKLIRNVSHHLNDPETRKIWRTQVQFERHILKSFPALLPVMFEAVVEYQTPALQPFWMKSNW